MSADAVWRFGAFVAVLLVFMAMEALAPARARTAARRERWLTNFAMFGLGGVLTRIAAPLGLMGVALWAEQNHIGVFAMLDAPVWMSAILCILALDLGLYLQHRAMHAIPALWRWHAPHHADPDLDASTGLRFHPGEALLSFGWKAALVVVLGAPPIAVLIFEIILNAFSIFTHANVALPLALDRALSWVMITPRAHRLHHDRDAGRDSGNYGFSIVLWDKLWGTWSQRAEPLALGLREISPHAGTDLSSTIAMPFQKMDA